MKNVNLFNFIEIFILCMIYLIEPYNAYQKPAKKKHPAEIAEEEALFYRMMEARKQSITNNQNLALPQYSPQPSSQQIVQSTVAGLGAGAGGWVPVAAAEQTEAASFGASVYSGVAPLQVSFTNYTPTPGNNTFFWQFGSGSLTSSAATPNPVTYTRNGTYTVILQSTSSTGYATSTSATITVSLPTLTAAFVGVPTTGPAPLSVQFTSNTVYNGSGNLTYRWEFNSGSLASTIANPLVTYSGSGVYSVALQVTESLFGITNRGLRTNYISASVA